MIALAAWCASPDVERKRIERTMLDQAKAADRVTVLNAASWTISTVKVAFKNAAVRQRRADRVAQAAAAAVHAATLG